jgi:hypothetical protein
VDGVDHIGFASAIAAHNAVDTLRGEELTLLDIFEIQ